MGPKPKNFIRKIWPGLGGFSGGRFKHFTGPLTLSMGILFAGRGGAVSGPVRRRFSLPEGGLGAHFRVPMLPAGEVGLTISQILQAIIFKKDLTPASPVA